VALNIHCPEFGNVVGSGNQVELVLHHTSVPVPGHPALVVVGEFNQVTVLWRFNGASGLRFLSQLADLSLLDRLQYIIHWLGLGWVAAFVLSIPSWLGVWHVVGNSLLGNSNSTGPPPGWVVIRANLHLPICHKVQPVCNMGWGYIIEHDWWEPVLLGEFRLEQPPSKVDNVGMVLNLVPWLVSNTTSTILLELKLISIQCGIESAWTHNDGGATLVLVIHVIVVVIFNGLVLVKTVKTVSG
jgi:hypothetical protein